MNYPQFFIRISVFTKDLSESHIMEAHIQRITVWIYGNVEMKS